VHLVPSLRESFKAIKLLQVERPFPLWTIKDADIIRIMGDGIVLETGNEELLAGPLPAKT